MKLIGLTGKARVGKDTVANFLMAEHDYVRMAFADPLKRAAAEIFGLTAVQMQDEFKEIPIEYWGMSPREIFQKLGTEGVRDVFGPEVWVKRLGMGLDAVRHTSNVVITDVRFRSEADFLKSQGATLVEIRRDVSDVRSHSSEAGIGMCADFVIENNSSVDALYGQIELMLGAL